jgi:DNA-binding CsgD family transcriptional regulator/ribosomal protein S27AE
LFKEDCFEKIRSKKEEMRMAEEIPTFDDMADDEDGNWMCNKCGREFTTSHGLTLHNMRAHEGHNWRGSRPKKRGGKASEAPESVKRQMREFFDAGKSRKEIAEGFGYSYGFVAKYLHSVGRGQFNKSRLEAAKAAEAPQQRHWLKRKQKGKIKKLFKKGYRRVEIAEKLGIPYSTIGNYLSRAGFHQRVYVPRGRYHRMSKDPWKLAKLTAQKALMTERQAANGYKLEEGQSITVKAIRCPHCGKLMVLERVGE